jgi:hypothetical protein
LIDRVGQAPKRARTTETRDAWPATRASRGSRAAHGPHRKNPPPRFPNRALTFQRAQCAVRVGGTSGAAQSPFARVHLPLLSAPAHSVARWGTLVNSFFGAPPCVLPTAQHRIASHSRCQTAARADNADPRELHRSPTWDSPRSRRCQACTDADGRLRSRACADIPRAPTALFRMWRQSCEFQTAPLSVRGREEELDAFSRRLYGNGLLGAELQRSAADLLLTPHSCRHCQARTDSESATTKCTCADVPVRGDGPETLLHAAPDSLRLTQGGRRGALPRVVAFGAARASGKSSGAQEDLDESTISRVSGKLAAEFPERTCGH